MNTQTGKQVRKFVFNEALLQRVAETQTSISMVLLIHISMVVWTYCRMAMYIYGGKSVMKQ